MSKPETNSRLFSLMVVTGLEVLLTSADLRPLPTGLDHRAPTHPLLAHTLPFHDLLQYILLVRRTFSHPGLVEIVVDATLH
jgi:hypothetical protein